MAVTDGHGNGAWTRDETILALDLYLHAGKALDSGDSRVKELSEYLRSLPLHPPEKKKGSFRNPAGVSFKILNLRAVQTGRGLKNVSAMDKEVWNELGHQPKLVRSLARQIRAACSTIQAISTITYPQSDEDESFVEGGAITVLHRRLERKRKLREQVLRNRLSLGPLKCDACGRGDFVHDGQLEPSAYEAHHVTPLAHTGRVRTTAADMALLCATCHRLIHRAMVVEKRWVSLPQFRVLLSSNGS